MGRTNGQRGCPESSFRVRISPPADRSINLERRKPLFSTQCPFMEGLLSPLKGYGEHVKKRRRA